MKTTTFVALAMGLLIAMIPAAAAFQPVLYQPPYGKAVKGNLIAGGKPQYWNTHAAYQIQPTKYGTKYGGESMLKAIQFDYRNPGGYKARIQRGIERQQGTTSAVTTVTSVEGKPGASGTTLGTDGAVATQ